MTLLSQKPLHIALLLSLLVLIAPTPLGAAGEVETPGFVVEEQGPYPLQIIDSFDREVRIPSAPQRVISLGPNVTETIYALNLEKRLVGRTLWCDYPPEAETLPVVGSLMEPNIEAIVALDPDLVIASTHFQKESLRMMEQLKIPTLVLYGKNRIEGVYDIIRGVAAAFAVDSAGEAYIRKMQDRIRSLRTRLEGRKKPRVYYVIGFGESGNYTAGGDTFIHEILELAGGINIAADLDGWSYSLEMLLKQDPDLLICSDEPGVRERLMKTPGYRELTAVETGRVYTIDIDIIDRQGPRLIEGVERLAAILHPDIFE